MPRDKPLMHWKCLDCGTVGFTTETVVNATHPQHNHYASPEQRCITAGLRGLLVQEEARDEDLVFIVGLRARIKDRAAV